MEIQLEIIAKDKNGKEFNVKEISMGQSRTRVEMVEQQESANSIDYTFFLDDKEIDIYQSSLFNPYITDYDNLIYFVKKESDNNDRSNGMPF